MNPPSKVDVRQDHIDEGKIGSAIRCPLALAINEAFGMESRPEEQLQEGAIVVGWIARMHFKDRFFCSDLSEDAKDFIWCFDRGLKVEPQTFNFQFLEGE